MRILITGATGFLGRHVLEELKKYSYIYTTLLVSSPIEGYDCILHNGYTYTKDIFGNRKFDVVIHMGSVTPKGFGREKVKDYLDNIKTTVHLFENLPNNPKKVIFTSSVSVYDSNGEMISERSKLTSSDSYGLSKIICEQYLIEWAKEYQTNINILRLGSIYGPGEEKYNKLVGSFIQQVVNKRGIEIYSNGTEKRNLIYVKDVAKCIIQALQSWDNLKIINVVSNQEISIDELAKKVINIVDKQAVIMYGHNQGGRDDVFDSTEIVELVGDNFFTSYNDGISETYAHYTKVGVV